MSERPGYSAPRENPRRAPATPPAPRRMIPASLLSLARAAAAGLPVRVAYREAGPAPWHAELTLLSLGWRFGGWVALARARTDGGLRVLEAERVEAVRPLERRRRPRGRAHPGGPHPPRASGGGVPPAVDPVEFALADLQDPGAGPARRVTVVLPRPLAPLAAALLPGGEVEPVPGGARVHLRVTDLEALSRMVASLGARLD